MLLLFNFRAVKKYGIQSSFRNMKKVTRLLSGIIALLILGLYLYWHIYDDSYVDILEAKTEIHTNVAAIMSIFILDQQQANSTYKEKIVEVTGIVEEVSFLNKKCTVFLAAGKTKEEGYIICDMQTNQIHSVQQLKAGDTVLIKGVFKGFLMDGIMLNCVLLNTNIDE